MNDEARLMIIGVYLWGAIYAAGVFVAALVLAAHLAMFLMLVSAGIAYLCQALGAEAMLKNDQVLARYSRTLQVSSVITGVAAGLFLLVGI